MYLHIFLCLQNVEKRMLSSRVELQKATQTMDTNPIKTAITVCSELIRKKVGQSTGSYTSNFSKL